MSRANHRIMIAHTRQSFFDHKLIVVFTLLLLGACAQDEPRSSALDYQPTDPFTARPSPRTAEAQPLAPEPELSIAEEALKPLPTQPPLQAPKPEAVVQEASLPAGVSTPHVQGVPQTSTLPQIQEVPSLSAKEEALPTIYRAKAGDTLYGLSKKFSVSMPHIIALNELKPPYKLIIGKVYVIPSEEYHQVFPGDTLASIARAYGVERSELMERNKISSLEEILIPGEVLVLPNVPFSGVQQDVKVEQRKTTETKPAKPIFQESEAKQQARLALNKIPNASLSDPPKRSRKTFLAPVQGKILKSFGERTDGIREEGIRYEVPIGTDVKAAENGVVIFGDASLSTLGNLILIRHADGYYTAYAHNRSLSVKRGEVVRRGQIIAKSGDSGDVDRPQLMFQIRKQRKAVDPQSLLSR